MHVLRFTLWLMVFCVPSWAQTSSTLSLSMAINQALQGSPALSSAKAALSAAEGTERQAGALSNPELGFEAENLAGSGEYRGTEVAEYTYSISQKVELGGKRTSRRSLAGAERQARHKDMQATQLDIIRDVTMAYAEVLVTEDKLKLAIARESLAKDVLANVSQRVGAARDPLIYKNQADVTLATARLENQKVQRDLQLAKRKLASLWGDTTLNESLESTVLTSVTAPEPLDVYQSKLAANPDLQRYEDLRSAKAAAFQLEKTQNIPDPSFSLGVRDFAKPAIKLWSQVCPCPSPSSTETAATLPVLAPKSTKPSRMQSKPA